MPGMTKLTDTQVRILRNIRDHGDGLWDFFGLQIRGGATTSLTSLIRRGLVDGRTLTLTEAGGQTLVDLEPKGDLISYTRRVLREAGFQEDRGYSPWGYKVIPGTVKGLVRIEYTRGHDRTTKESSVRFANEQITGYVRALQKAGLKVSRVKGVREPDRLLVQEKDLPAT